MEAKLLQMFLTLNGSYDKKKIILKIGNNN